MIISLKHQFVFFSNPKCATTSIEAALKNHCEIRISGTKYGKHIPPSKFSNWEKLLKTHHNCGKLKKICTARHPIEKIISWYTYRSRNKLKKINPQRYLGDTPFEDFCKSAMQANGNNFFHSSINSKFLVDVVVPIEYLGHLSEYLESTLGQDLLIPTKNKSPGRTKNYTDEYFSLGNKLLATASYEFQKSVLIYEHIRDTYKTINYKQMDAALQITADYFYKSMNPKRL